MPRRFEFYTSDYFPDEDIMSETGEESEYYEDSDEEYRPNIRRVNHIMKNEEKYDIMNADYSKLTSLVKTNVEEELPKMECQQVQAKTWGIIQKPKIVSISNIQKQEEEDKLVQKRLLSKEKITQTKSTRDKHELLCIYGPKHGSKHDCKMAHNLKIWKPKTCRFNKCRNGNKCIFWHNNSESLVQFLTRSIQNENSYFYRNREYYRKHYLTRNS